MYADISKPPAPLPKAEPQCISEGVTLLPPLSRRGYGKGLIILQHDSTQHLDIVEGVPSALIKWAEEGFVVVEIQAKALTNPSLATDVLQTALKALKDCSKLEKDSRFGVVAFDPTLWNKIAGVACIFPDIVGAVTEGIATYRYAKAKSFRLATPFHEDFDYWSESLSHTRNLTFLKSLIGGPYFDLEAIWDEHTYYEFADRSVEHTMSTMVDQPYVNHVPTLTGGIGRGPLTQFYRNNFIFNNSQDTELELISRTLGIDRVVDEFIYKFTHDTVVDWLVPGIPPTYKKVEIPFTAVVNIRGDRLYHEHISWDQGTVLAQLGLMPQYLPFPYPIKGQDDGATFEYRVPVLGIDTAEKMRDRNSVVSNDMFNFKVRKS
ncbi:carboxymethylenebutenolidase [Colletotrichum costaricense]|uniref:Carboxymethylenebutenolidase n=1 Tax=Colletotrichum costaricense TaxID=1209916 RepID=A0AAJ0DY84_9PEZI|nr:carboxymethylenebutenolidase [Colletotrichum costaricense]KAK1522246.1 carboxymethylenebutenolidase [Colletotrichum costaricense]